MLRLAGDEPGIPLLQLLQDGVRRRGGRFGVGVGGERDDRQDGGEDGDAAEAHVDSREGLQDRWRLAA
jgi:hypothetical protein